MRIERTAEVIELVLDGTDKLGAAGDHAGDDVARHNRFRGIAAPAASRYR